MHKDSKYVFFLDDDVQLCPGTIGALVAHMEKYPEVLLTIGPSFDFFCKIILLISSSFSTIVLSPFCYSLTGCIVPIFQRSEHWCTNLQIFVLTGYPFDIPSGSLGSYCIYEYHMVYSWCFLNLLLSPSLSMHGEYWVKLRVPSYKLLWMFFIFLLLWSPFKWFSVWLFVFDKTLNGCQPCSIGFATGGCGRTFFLWGGCMMVRIKTPETHLLWS